MELPDMDRLVIANHQDIVVVDKEAKKAVAVDVAILIDAT